MDNEPVADATVTLVKEGKDQDAGSPTGMTDSSGVVKIKTGEKDGVSPGKYKVLVTKIEKPKGVSEGGDPMENMKNAAKSNPGGGGGGPPGRPGGGGGGPPGPGGGGGRAGNMGMKLSNLLPDKYSKVETTDLTIEVPTDGTVNLKLSK